MLYLIIILIQAAGFAFGYTVRGHLDARRYGRYGWREETRRERAAMSIIFKA